jgi:lipase chaperone LimK
LILKSAKLKQWLFVIVTVLLIYTLYILQKSSDSDLSEPLVKNTTELIEYNKEEKPISTKKKVVESLSPQELVHSYQGSQPDGAIHLDDSGNVIVDKDLKRLFDYYLSAIGELPLDQMRKYLQQFVENQLNPTQLQQVLDYFDKYHNYLNRSDEFSQTLESDLNLQEKMILLSEFREDNLGAEMANAFFGDEQNYIDFVMTDKESEDWTQQQQKWLESENQATEFQDVVLENREFATREDLSSEQIYQYRVDEYGQETAERLTQLDQKRAQWQEVVNDYFLQRQQIENQQVSLSIEQLNSQYTTQEVRRLEALWRISNQ